MSAPDGDPAPVALDDAVEELYGLVRDDFIPRRDELAKQARAAGDRGTATAIGRLRKPSVAAWLANVLAREHPDEIGALEGLGASMREAQQRLEGDALRRLSRQRHELLHALVERGRRIAREDGVRIGDAVVREVERTITAALADTEAARAMAAGRLVTALEPGAGLGNASAVSSTTSRTPVRPRTRRAPPPAAPAAPASDEASEPDGDAAQERADRERVRWEQERERLAGVVEDARAGAERAAEVVREAETAVEGARAQVTDAVSALAELRERVAAAETAERAARDRAAEAERVVAASRRDAADAADRLRRAETDLDAHDG